MQNHSSYINRVNDHVGVSRQDEEETSKVKNRNLKDDANANAPKEVFDTWDVFDDEYCWGYGYNGASSSLSSSRNGEMTSLPFRILGTNGVKDEECHPHVLSPPLMESLQSFVGGDNVNFYLKYSLLRDGPSLLELLKRVSGCPHTILALQTLDGHVFGSYTTHAWRPTWGYYGSNAFVWRMRQSRLTPCQSLLHQAILESELDVFPYTGNNNCIQLCRRDKIAIGGGGDFENPLQQPQLQPKEKETVDSTNPTKQEGTNEKTSQNQSFPKESHHYGFAISLGSNLTYGSTSTSETFNSPCLNHSTGAGARIQISNLEVWSLTQHSTTQQAEKDEDYYNQFADNGQQKDTLSLFGILTGRT